MTTLLNLVTAARWRAVGVVSGSDGLSAVVIGFVLAGVLPLITGRSSKEPV